MAIGTQDIKAGVQLPPLEKTVEQHHIDLFEALSSSEERGTRGNYHTDPDAAKKALGGFDKPIASGRMAIDYGLQALAKWFGRDAVNHSGRVDLRFLVPIVAGDTVRVHGVVTYARESDQGTSVNTALWLENEKAQKVAVGTGSLRLPKQQ